MPLFLNTLFLRLSKHKRKLIGKRFFVILLPIIHWHNATSLESMRNFLLNLRHKFYMKILTWNIHCHAWLNKKQIKCGKDSKSSFVLKKKNTTSSIFRTLTVTTLKLNLFLFTREKKSIGNNWASISRIIVLFFSISC